METRAWYRGLALARALLVVLCLFSQLLHAPRSGWIAFFLIGYLLFSLAVLSWRQAARFGGALLGLFADTIFFLVFSRYGSDYNSWLGSAFYFYLLLSAVMIHHWRDVCVVVGACCGYFAVAGGAAVLWRVVLWTGLLACLASFEKQRIERLLAERTRETVDLRSKAESARQTERQKLAGDFHDGPLQSFISVQLRLEVLRKILERNLQAGMEELRELQELAKSQAHEVRAFLRGIRPVDVEEQGLTASLRRVVADFQKDSGMTATFQGGDGVGLDRPEAAVEVLQIVREALHNVQKHSKATRVAVTAHQSGKFLEISIEDNGTGFAFSGTYTLEELDLLRMGPLSIKTRVRSLHGQLTAESRPERGAALRIRIPA